MAYVTLSPADQPIPLRDLRFNRDPARHPRWWHGGDAVATTFFNALSCTFPEGERFFMESVRAFRDQVPEPLRSQIGAFIAQEAVHSREHNAFNHLAEAAGYDVVPLEARTSRVLGFARTRSAVDKLGATAALEHFTAILAHALLAGRSRDLAGAPDDAVRLWSWHAVEEIEHKAVSFDALLWMTRDWPAPRRYLFRIRTMLIATLLLFTTIRANMRDLFRQDALPRGRTWLRTLHYLWFRPGILRRVSLPYLAYFLPGFHPWRRDDRALLAAAQARLGLNGR